jgi:hypothetical protein
LWTLGKLLGSRLHSGANGGKLGSRCAKACDEIENLFEEDGAIEAPVDDAKLAEFGVRVVVGRMRVHPRIVVAFQ